MAVNGKEIYATEYTSHGGKLFRPGEQMSGRVDQEVLRHATEGGLTTTSHAEAERAKAQEAHRQERVRAEIKTRSEKRESAERSDPNIPRLVKLPDGSFAYAPTE